MEQSYENGNRAQQLHVRLGLKAGQSIEQCTKNVQTWQKDFTDKYNKAVKNGYQPPFANPLA